MKSEVTIGSDIIIQFHNDSTDGVYETPRGTVHGLRFNKI